MDTVSRIQKLIKDRDINVSILCKATKISTGNFTDWKNKKSNPSLGAILKIAKYFGVSSEYLLGETPDPTPPGEVLVVPDVLKNIRFAFDRGEFEDLTQSEVDALANIAATLKKQRKL